VSTRVPFSGSCPLRPVFSSRQRSRLGTDLALYVGACGNTAKPDTNGGYLLCRHCYAARRNNRS
jgi:hypothetical protein